MPLQHIPIYLFLKFYLRNTTELYRNQNNSVFFIYKRFSTSTGTPKIAFTRQQDTVYLQLQQIGLVANKIIFNCQESFPPHDRRFDWFYSIKQRRPVFLFPPRWDPSPL